MVYSGRPSGTCCGGLKPADLASSVHRIEGLTGMSDDPGWLRCDALLGDPPRFGDWHKLLADWLGRQYEEVPARTVAAWVMSWYLHVPAAAGALLFQHERRVPSLDPAGLAFKLSDDRPHPEGIAVFGTAFYCLPTDPGATLPEATVVADEHALAEVLRNGYLAHADRFVDAYKPLTRFGRRTLRAAAMDALESALTLAGTAAADVTRRRESCCFSYLLAETPVCDDCPRLSLKK